ncbi:GNAT family N-acetyltransferase [Kineococcus sp. SYSU DK002]|uniref:GNAT family N-acetyltransferase n=1 Tax=Kineococcus sp. SYSU DK002 TaxID=3383123 RepID=UPI003D7C8C10
MRQGRGPGRGGSAGDGRDGCEEEVRPGVRWRAVRAEDAAALSRICRLTGDAGRDASDLTAFPDLLGDVYAAPYAHHEAAFGTLVLDEEGPAGYVLGCLDTARFERWRADRWWPPLRERYPRTGDRPLDAGLLRSVHEPVVPSPVWTAFPSHLHVDLLPRLQGRGVGRALIERLCGQLAAAGSPGVHLGVSAANPGAVAFYRRTGFTELEATATGHTFGRVLSPAGPAAAPGEGSGSGAGGGSGEAP